VPAVDYAYGRKQAFFTNPDRTKFHASSVHQITDPAVELLLNV